MTFEFSSLPLYFIIDFHLYCLYLSLGTRAYKKITQNQVYVELKKWTYVECGCHVTDVSPCSIKNNCINVLSNIECTPKSCPAKERCQNQKFLQGVQFSLKVQRTKAKGWGLFAMENIPTEAFVIEYMGEFIANREFEHRFKHTPNEKFYYLALNQNMFIDPTHYGNDARFINHSCEPNAAAHKWIVQANGQEEIRVVLFASREIQQIDYIKSDFHLYQKLKFCVLCREKK